MDKQIEKYLEKLKELHRKQGLDLSGEDEGGWQIHEETKSFLRSSLQQYREAVIEETVDTVKNMKKYWKGADQKLLDDVITQLKGLTNLKNNE